MRKPLALLLLLFALTGPAFAHLGEPLVQNITFPANRPETVFVVIDNVGLLAGDAGRFTWLCDEAITAFPGLNGIAAIDGAGEVFVAATRQGVTRSIDNGCGFAAVDGPLGQHYAALLSPHPGHVGEAVVATQTIGANNDVWRTTDTGLTWTPAGLDLEGRARTLRRAEADPQVIYLSHTTGAARSDDGGASFTPIALGPPDQGITGADFELLATDPHDAHVVYATFVRFPDSALLRSADGGLTWETLVEFPDVPESLIIGPDGRMLLSMPFEGLRRSTDGGATWTEVPLPAQNLWMSCLTRSPDGRIWACTRRTAPWLVGVSDDGGDSWSPVFASDFSDIRGGWGCAAETTTATKCAAACDRSRQNCGTDAGLPDAGPVDGGIHTDATTGHETTTTDPGDCATVPGHGSPGLVAWFALVGLAVCRRRVA
ncbi:MAG: hypothetical protein KC620_04515 [Myxococcales bacterium]|nr:hypothetical protein [Myxococcales bacterium]